MLLPVIRAYAGNAKLFTLALRAATRLEEKPLAATLLLIHDHDFDPSDLVTTARTAFATVQVVPADPVLSGLTWPVPQNLVWQHAARYIDSRSSSLPFSGWLWWEADAVPLRRGWLATLSDAHRQGRKLFSGVPCRHANDETYMNGVGIYPLASVDALANCAALYCRQIPFDIAAGPCVVRSLNAIPQLITHELKIAGGSRGRSFTFSSLGDLLASSPSSVFYHGCDDGSLSASILSDSSFSDISSQLSSEPAAFTSPSPIDHDPFEMSAPDTAHDGSKWSLKNFMASVPIIRTPKTSVEPSIRVNRIIHCVQRWKPGNQDIDRRIHTAVLSWISLYKNGDMVPCHVWVPFKRDATLLGDSRPLPFLRDVLEEGMKLAKVADDIILLTNDDSILHPELDSELLTRLAIKSCVCAGRLSFQRGEKPDFTTSRTFLTKSNDIGRDAFAFRFDWLKENFTNIPDMLLAEAQFDLVLGSMIRKANGVKPTLESRVDAHPKAELPYGWVQHEDHVRGWNCGPTPGQIHNLKIAADWYGKNKMAHMVDFNYTA